METVSSLFCMKKWLEEQIQREKIRLKSPQPDDKTDTYALVAPAVHVGYIPPKAILNKDMVVRVPGLIVGTTEIEDDGESSRMDLRITAVVWDSGTQRAADDSSSGLQLTPGFDGYVTLLNLLDNVKRWIRRDDGLSEQFHLDSTVRLSTYDEQPWPYWYGTVACAVTTQPDPTTRYAQALN